jgi:hypothetical protein
VQAGTKIEVSSHAKWYLRSETSWKNFVSIPPCSWGDVHKMPGGLPPSDRPTHLCNGTKMSLLTCEWPGMICTHKESLWLSVISTTTLLVHHSERDTHTQM